jgi:SAM-dependent methyltransferase
MSNPRPQQAVADVPALTFTGERYLPELVGEIRQEHMHRYAWALATVEGLDVIDVACGEGFGSSMLASRARSVIGVDVAQDAVDHATARYEAGNLRFICADAAEIPVPDASADVVVSFETIEHLSDQGKAMAEIRRILRPGGFLVMSSPDTEIYAVKQGHANRFHTKELTGPEFAALLRREFPAVRLFGQRLSVTSSILPCDGDGDGSASVFRDDGTVERSAREIPSTMYLIALAAAREDCLPDVSPSFLVTAGYDVYWEMREREARIDAERERLATEVRSLQQLDRARIILASGLFSPSFYLTQAQLPPQSSVSLALDYLNCGEAAGLQPSPLFDPVHYLAHNPDVAKAGVSPLMHYVQSGLAEGRMPIAPQAPSGSDAEPPQD